MGWTAAAKVWIVLAVVLLPVLKYGPKFVRTQNPSRQTEDRGGSSSTLGAACVRREPTTRQLENRGQPYLRACASQARLLVLRLENAYAATRT